MCWSLTASAGFAAVGSVATLAAARAGRPRSHVLMLAYFTAMEALQAAQYLVISDCASVVNQTLTVLGYLHVCFQPLVVNTYVFSRSASPDGRAMVLRLCVASGLFLAARLPGLASRLGGLLNPAWAAKAAGSGFEWSKAPWPDLPPAAASGVPALCGLDAMCGRRLCSFAGTKHVAWSLPLTPPSYFIPSSFIHFFMFFIPALITPGPDWPFRLAVAGFGFITGPLFAFPRSTGKHYTFEWPATWCAYSIAQVALVLAMEAWAWGTVGGGAVRGRGRARRAKKHA